MMSQAPPLSPLHLENGKSSPSATSVGPRLCRLRDLLGEWETDATQAHQARLSGQARGPVSGFKQLDAEMGGCFAPGLHFVHGQPGTGKTAFGLQIAASCGTPALFVTCEMAPLELLRRHTARTTQTYLGRLKSGEIAPLESLALVRRAVSLAPQMCLLDATCAPAPPSFLRDCIAIARGESPHLLVVIDSLQSWVEGVLSDASEYEALGEGIARLRQIAHEAGVPVFLMCERNRESMKNGGLSAGAGTRKIEYSAESVIDLSCADDAREDVHGAKDVRLRLTKNRHGTVGKSLEFQFVGRLQSFSPTSTRP